MLYSWCINVSSCICHCCWEHFFECVWDSCYSMFTWRALLSYKATSYIPWSWFSFTYFCYYLWCYIYNFAWMSLCIVNEFWTVFSTNTLFYWNFRKSKGFRTFSFNLPLGISMKMITLCQIQVSLQICVNFCQLVMSTKAANIKLSLLVVQMKFRIKLIICLLYGIKGL